MAEPREEGELPQAMVAPPKRHRLSIVWIIPILARWLERGAHQMRERGTCRIG